MSVQILSYNLLQELSKVQYPGSFFFLNLFLISPIILNIPGFTLENGGENLQSPSSPHTFSQYWFLFVSSVRPSVKKQPANQVRLL